MKKIDKIAISGEDIMMAMLDSYFEMRRELWTKNKPPTITMRLRTRQGFERDYKWPRDSFTLHFRMPVYSQISAVRIEDGETPQYAGAESVDFRFIEWIDEKEGLALYEQF